MNLNYAKGGVYFVFYMLASISCAFLMNETLNKDSGDKNGIYDKPIFISYIS